MEDLASGLAAHRVSDEVIIIQFLFLYHLLCFLCVGSIPKAILYGPQIAASRSRG